MEIIQENIFLKTGDQLTKKELSYIFFIKE